MGRFILKPDPDEDLYCEWSSIVDNVCSTGTRQEYANQAAWDHERGRNTDFTDERFERADRTGTSGLDGYSDGWEDRSGFVVHNLIAHPARHAGWLKGEDFLQYVQLLHEGKTLEAEMLVGPFEDDLDNYGVK